jgi:hypothetical protein
LATSRPQQMVLTDFMHANSSQQMHSLQLHRCGCCLSVSVFFLDPAVLCLPCLQVQMVAKQLGVQGKFDELIKLLAAARVSTASLSAPA